MFRKLINTFKAYKPNNHPKIFAGNRVKDNIKIKVHDIEALKSNVENWGELTKREKWQVANNTKPTKVIEEHNTTVDGLNEYIVDNLDPSQSVNKDASHIEIGSDNTGGTSTSDTSMNTLVDTLATTDEADNGKDLFTSTFIDTSQLNGNSLEEAGLTTASSGGTLLNHSTFTAISKDNTKTVTIDITLEFRAA